MDFKNEGYISFLGLLLLNYHKLGSIKQQIYSLIVLKNKGLQSKCWQSRVLYRDYKGGWSLPMSYLLVVATTILDGFCHLSAIPT